MMERVAIIGAGVAGLRLGGLLQGQGMAVRLFDKARGAAGRIATRRLDGGRFDHGAQYLTARHPVFSAQLEDWLARGVVARWPAKIVSLERGAVEAESTPTVRYVGVPGMSAIARDLARGLPLETGVRIASARRVHGKWTLASEDGAEFAGFDGLVSAVPAPQAPPFLAESSALMQRVHQARFKACHAAMVSFAEPLEVDFDAAFVRGSELGWAAREASKPGREASNAWVLHSTPAFSESNLEMPPEQVLEALCTALSEATARELPARSGSAVHRWLYARAVGPATGSVLWDPAQGLGVCGDWLQGERIEDAFLSAERLAEAMRASHALSAAL